MKPNDFAGIMNGVVIILTELIRQMDSKQLIDKQHFAERLDALSDRDDLNLVQQRLDLVMMKNLADLLRNPEHRPSWDPQVIDGGRSPEEDS